MSEDIPENMLDKIPENISGYMSEDMSNRMPHKMPENISDKIQKI